MILHAGLYILAPPAPDTTPLSGPDVGRFQGLVTRAADGNVDLHLMFLPDVWTTVPSILNLIILPGDFSRLVSLFVQSTRVTVYLHGD